MKKVSINYIRVILFNSLMKKLSFYKYDIKLILNLANTLKTMFNIPYDKKVPKNSIEFDLKKDYKNKTITIKFKEGNNE